MDFHHIDHQLPRATSILTQSHFHPYTEPPPAILTQSHFHPYPEPPPAILTQSHFHPYPELLPSLPRAVAILTQSHHQPSLPRATTSHPYPEPPPVILTQSNHQPSLPRATAAHHCHFVASRHSEVEALQDGPIRVVAEVNILKRDSGAVRSHVNCRGPWLLLTNKMRQVTSWATGTSIASNFIPINHCKCCNYVFSPNCPLNLPDAQVLL